MLAKQSRNPAMDVVRCFALFCVVAVHFFKNSGFYEETVLGSQMFIMVLIRSGFMVCVPLFIVLSGYLMNGKKASLQYYLGITKTLCMYLLASICCQLYKCLFQDQPLSLSVFVIDLFSFSAAPYSWYVEMYIGLFLMIPFLNILYNNIPTKKEKQLLILIFLILTSLPSIINIYNAYYIFNTDWWKVPSSYSTYHQILPEWWTGMYPLTYYFLGCYMKEFPLKVSKRRTLIIYFLVYLLNGAFNYYRSYHAAFIWGDWQDWGSILNVLQTVLVFHFLSQFDYACFGPKTKKFLATLSNCCFGAYLVSWIFDQYFYGILNQIQPVAKLRIHYFAVIVPFVFVCSLCLSFVLNKLYTFVSSKTILLYKKASAPRT